MKHEEQSGAQALQANRDKLGRDVADVAHSVGDALKDLASAQVEAGREALARAQGVATDRARRYSGVADEYVHTHPWKAMGAAAVAGIAIGLMLRR